MAKKQQQTDKVYGLRNFREGGVNRKTLQRRRSDSD